MEINNNNNNNNNVNNNENNNNNNNNNEIIKNSSYILFNNISFNLLSYLETFEDEICDINFNTSTIPLKLYEINLYERRLAPIELPIDFKRFLLLFNGIHLKWRVKIGEQSVLIGEIKINKLDQILPVQLDGQFLPTEAAGLPITIPDVKTSTSYVFSSCEEGIVVFLYRDQIPTFPEIWFVDNSKRWHFICFSFTQYLRLAVLHLGIIGWHHIYTPEGISMTTRQWMGMFCRERLCVYQNQRI